MFHISNILDLTDMKECKERLNVLETESLQFKLLVNINILNIYFNDDPY